MQLAALERRLLDVECELTQLRRQRSRDDEALVDGLQQRLQTERGAKRPIKEEHVKAAAALARDPAFARDPALKKEDSWWASFPVPPGKARTDARKNASTILEKGWLDELCGQPAPATAAAPLNASVILQLENEEGERFGPQLDVPINATRVQLQKLLSHVLSDHAVQDCAFRVLGGGDVTATLGEALQSVSTERSVRLVYTVPAVEKTDAYCERLGLERITLENAAEYTPPKLWDFKPATRTTVDSPPAIWYWRMTGGNWSDSERSLSHEYHIVVDRWRRLLDEHHEREARRDRLRKIEREVTRAGELLLKAQDRYDFNCAHQYWVKKQSFPDVDQLMDPDTRRCIFRRDAEKFREARRTGSYNEHDGAMRELTAAIDAAEQRMVKATAHKKRADGWALLHGLAAEAGRLLGRSQPVELMDGNAFGRYVEMKECWSDSLQKVAGMLEAPAAQLVADLAQCLVCHLTFKGEHPSAISATADVNELSAAFIEFELRRDTQSGMLSCDEVIALLDACDSWLDTNGDEYSPYESDLFDRSNRLAELGCHWCDPTTRSEALESTLAVEDGYFGEQKNGVREGHGAMRWANGDVYVGQWQAGEPHGLGTMRYGDGVVFDGQWSEGQRVPVWDQTRSACHVGSWAVPALVSEWVARQQQMHQVGFSQVGQHPIHVQWLEAKEEAKLQAQREREEAEREKARYEQLPHVRQMRHEESKRSLAARLAKCSEYHLKRMSRLANVLSNRHCGAWDRRVARLDVEKYGGCGDLMKELEQMSRQEDEPAVTLRQMLDTAIEEVEEMHTQKMEERAREAEEREARRQAELERRRALGIPDDKFWAAKMMLKQRAAEAMRATDEEAAVLSEEQRCHERGECGPLKAEAFDVVSRLCEANNVTDCPKHLERLSRLLSIKEHGRPGPCQRCGATLMCSFTPEGEPSKLFCIGRVRHRRTQDDGYVRGVRKIKEWWEWADCGWSRKVTSENKAKLLCWPLVDSDARDLRKVVQEQNAPSCSASASASASLGFGLGSGGWSASAPSCAQDASSCLAEADTAPTTCAAPLGAPSSPTPATPHSSSRERVGEEESEAGGVAEGKQDSSSDSESIEICNEPPDDNDVNEMHEYYLPMD